MKSFMEADTDASNGESNELQSDCHMSAGDGEDEDDDEPIVSPAVDPAPTRAAVPVRRTAQSILLASTADRCAVKHLRAQKGHFRTYRG